MNLLSHANETLPRAQNIFVGSIPRGHLLFAIATTAYILIAIQLEEHDLDAALGDEYRDYRRRVPMLIPWRHRGDDQTVPTAKPRPA